MCDQNYKTKKKRITKFDESSMKKKNKENKNPKEKEKNTEKDKEIVWNLLPLYY